MNGCIKENGSILECGKNDATHALGANRIGIVASTDHRRPLKLVYYEACLNENDAIAREKYFKTGFGRRFLRNRIENYIDEVR